MGGYSAGLLGFHSTKIDDGRVAAALAVTPWRGRPTSTHVTGSGQIYALGEASSAREDGVSIVLHGRIDRLPNTDADLPTGASGLDTCLALIDAYRRGGRSFVDRLTGDFALILVDERSGTMLAARDWMAVRPLFWGRSARGVAFASEPTQVLALLGEPYRLDERTLEAWARGDNHDLDATFDLTVRALHPAGRVVVGSGGEARAWREPVRFRPATAPHAEVLREVRRCLDTAVRRRTAGAARLGALISGGLDSTTVAAVAASLAQRGEGPPLAAGFTAAFPDAPACDEGRYAHELARRWSVPWHAVPVPAADFDAFPAGGFGRHLGPVFPTYPFFPRFFEAARADGVDVLLTGQGGDLWVTQDRRELRLSVLRDDIPGMVRWGLHGLRTRPRPTAGQLIHGLRGRWLRAERAEALFEARHPFSMRLAFEAEERDGMRHGIRVEVPFTDRDLAEILAGVRPSHRSTPTTRKRISRDVTTGLLPAVVRLRRSRTEFSPWIEAAMGPADQATTPLATALRHYAGVWRDGVHAGSFPGEPAAGGSVDGDRC